MLGNAAYFNTNYLISLYKVLLTQDVLNCHFNCKLFLFRINIEYAFGILNEYLESVVDLCILLRSKDAYKFVVKWIIACCVLYKIMVNICDNWKRHKRWWFSEEIKKYDEKLLVLSENQVQKRFQIRNQVKKMVFGLQ